MRKLIYKFVIFIFVTGLVLISYFTQPGAETNRNSSNASFAIADTQFQIGAINNGWLSMYNYIKSDLNFNVWHHYTKLDTGWNKDTRDNYRDTIQSAIIVANKLDENNSYQMRTYFDRPIVEYILAGQRTDYQCEAVPNSNIYWFYSYYHADTNYIKGIFDITDNSRFGLNEDGITRATVKYCQKNSYNSDSTFLIVDSLKANRNLSNTSAANWWCNDNAWDWYVMPRIRIDSAYAAGTINNDTVVCRIVITGWTGETVKDIEIKVKNFKEDPYSSIYHGNYLDTFYFNTGQGDLKLTTTTINSHFLPDSSKKVFDWNVNCGVDIKIYWAGKVDMWIDRVRLENEPAHQYMTLKDDKILRKVNLEIGWAQTTVAGKIPNYFYLEEFTLSHVPAIAALNKQIIANSQPPNSNSLIVWMNNYQINEQTPHYLDCHLFSAQQLRAIFQDTCQINTMMIGSYPFWGYPVEAGYPSVVSYHPSTLSAGDYKADEGRLSYHKSTSEYDNWIQEHLDVETGIWEFTAISKLMDTLSKYGMRIINCPQAHLFYVDGGYLKEPTNEEIELQTDLAITYNAKGIMYYLFDSWGDINSPQGGYSRGIMDVSENTLVPRHSSQYGQDKYGKIKELSTKLNIWGPYIMKFDSAGTHSYIHRTERSSLLNETFYKDIFTYQPDNSNPDNPASQSENPSYRYLQVATFNNPNEQNSRYTMIINKRCSPYFPNEDNGGRRYVKVQFDTNHSSFDGFNNWKIIDLEDNSTVLTFNKRTDNLLNLGWFMPGQGKLYKIAPVMQEGGTLVCDEVPAPGSFTCDSTVFNNGHNITLYPSTTISFNPNGKIVMNGGNFITGSYASSQSSQPPMALQGNNCLWEGISLENCNIIEIGTTVFSNIKYDSLNSQNTAINIVNCFNFCISGCSFNLSTPSSAVDVSINNIGSSEWYNAYIGYNNFYFSSNNSNNRCPLNIESLADLVTPMYICNNNLVNGTQAINIAMNIVGVIGGTIRSNVITNFTDAITIMNSTLDLYNNYIYSNIENNDAVKGVSGSVINLSSNIGYYTGGTNHIITANSECHNINVDNSFFNIAAGNNLFNISSSSSSYHLFGTFPGYDTIQKANNNCFQLDTGNTQPINEVFWETNDPVVFDFGLSICEDSPSQDYEVFTFSNALNDTVFLMGSGMGGGEKGFNNTENTTENNFAKLYDSINVNVRKRNYTLIETQSKYLLTNYPDSIKTLAAISWLYYSTISRDSLTSRMTSLKTYYETLILNNSNNEALINRAFYFIQKCKVALKQYQDAMTGFQLIMTQHPYSFEGLVASWDYAATHLRDSLGGYGGGEKNQILNIKNKKLGEENINSERENELLELETYLNVCFTNYDSTKFKKSERVNIINNTKNSFERKKVKDTEIIENLKSRSEKGDKIAIRELQTKKAINEVVKVKKPGTQFELKKIISNDVNKIFARVNQTKYKETNIIPKDFSLYQNYPNPFNPVTKISFDLPKDAKVKLIVYDILGREVTRLLNSEFRSAGKHVIEFNAVNLNLASGVYFYRIETGDFNAVKKMLMIK